MLGDLERETEQPQSPTKRLRRKKQPSSLEDGGDEDFVELKLDYEEESSVSSVHSAGSEKLRKQTSSYYSF